MNVTLHPSGPLAGEVTPPADKSISHRGVILSALAEGRSRVSNYLRSEDVMSTVGVCRALGAEITEDGDALVIEGRGATGFAEPRGVLDCGNSGTTMRLMAGVLSGCPFFSVLAGDASLSGRPMGRVIEPLTRMGARFMARAGGKYPPVAVQGGGLRGIEYRLPVASAQLKSALLLAGLFAEGQTTVISPEPSRDHTERMLPAYGADLKVEGDRATVSGGARLKARDLTVPNDFSSAAFFMVASTLVEGSSLVIRNVGLNPTRTGLLDVLGRMGARMEILERRDVSGEPVGDLRVSAARLTCTEIGGSEVANIIDEFPVISVAAALASGVTRIRGAGELRVKESDRIATVAEGLRRMGVNVQEHEDGMDVHGTNGALLAGAEVESHGDHRIAMAFSVAALVAHGQTTVRGAEAVGISFPGFYEMLKRVGG